MEDPISIIDVFKFVAVRPAQKATDNEIERSFIRDARTYNPDGVQILQRLGRELATPEASLARWRQLDQKPLAGLVRAYQPIVERYEKLKEDDDLPSAGDLLGEHGIRDTSPGHITPLLTNAWDALYIADRTGADAGQRLEAPIAALRVLRFMQLVQGNPTPSREEALTALRTTPTVPHVIAEFATAPEPRPNDPNERPGTRDNVRSKTLRSLAQDLVASERLLETIVSAPAVSRPISSGIAETIEGGRNLFRVGNAPTLSSLRSGGISAEQKTMLDKLKMLDETPVFEAAHVLQAQVARLSQQAFELEGNAEFQTLLRESKGALAIRPADAGTIVAGPSMGDILALEDPGTVPDVNVSGRIVPLGIGDLKVVKQTLLAYVPGEVAHIENVLRGESKERKHRTLDRTETTVTTSEEETTETERDTQSTDRFELKRESENTIKEDMSVKAGLTVTAAFGPVVTTATGDFAYSTSKSDSQKSSSNFAHEIVDRSVSKVQKKTRTERITKTLAEVEEINTHGIDNVGKPDHVIGVYRWVDKRYRAQIYNYGARLLLEFIVPEPAAFYRASLIGGTLKNLDAKPPELFLNLSGGPLTVDDITENSYRKYVSRYQVAGVPPPPPLLTYTGTSIVKEGLDAGKTIGMASKDFVVPEGYALSYYSATITLLTVGAPKFTLQVGRDFFPVLNVNHPDEIARITNKVEGLPEELTTISGSVAVAAGAYDILSFAVSVQGICQRTTTAYDKWKLQAFEKIAAAYTALQNAYEEKVKQAEAAAGFAIVGQNPGMNRIVEKNELKKLCITMMTGQHFKQFNAMTDPADKPVHHPEVKVLEALSEGPIVQFFEQAFEWEQMTYLYYPYFWGQKKNWVEVSRLSDPDPLFAQFLTAGAARVVVPVPLAYVDAVQYMLQSKAANLRDRVWRGGARPTLDDPDGLYISITQELREKTDDLAGATPEGDPWEFTLPTTLVWLQPDGTLPSFI